MIFSEAVSTHVPPKLKTKLNKDYPLVDSYVADIVMLVTQSW